MQLRTVLTGLVLLQATTTAQPQNREGQLCQTIHPVDIVFVLESAHLANQSTFKEVTDFVKNVTEAFNVAPDFNRVGVVAFEKHAHDIVPLSGDLKLIASRLQQQKGHKDTCHNEGLNKAGKMLQNSTNRQKVVVLITDGSPSSACMTSVRENIANLHLNEIEVFTISVGTTNFSARYASPDGNMNITHFYPIKDFTELASTEFFETFILQSCRGVWSFQVEFAKRQQAKIEAEKKKNEATNVKIETSTEACSKDACGKNAVCVNEKNGEHKCICKKGTQDYSIGRGLTAGSVCGNCSTDLQADIVFALLSSSSTNFNETLAFVHRAVDAFPVRNGNVRIGALEYSDKARIMLSIKDGIDRPKIKAALKRQFDETKCQFEALEMSSQMLKDFGRKGVKQYIVVIADGCTCEEDFTAFASRIKKEDNIEVFAVSVNVVKDKQIKSMATVDDSKTGVKHYLKANDYKQLASGNFFENFQQQLCYEPST